jgi:hypothetical protein
MVPSAIEIKRWAQSVPPVGDVRPARCPACTAVGAPIGKPVVIVGHGLREREILGPVEHEDPAGGSIVVLLRRFRCRACAAVLTVVPRGVLRLRRYSAFAIAWALALFGLLGLTVTGVRERVTSWRATPYTSNLAWAALIRWTRDVRDRRLFPGLPRPPPSVTLRRVAARAAMALAGESPPWRRELGEDARAGYGGVVISSKSITV